MTETLPLPELVAAMRREHPGAHPYTLALLIQVQHGRMVTGQEVRRLLRIHAEPPAPVQTGME